MQTKAFLFKSKQQQIKKKRKKNYDSNREDIKKCAKQKPKQKNISQLLIPPFYKRRTSGQKNIIYPT